MGLTITNIAEAAVAEVVVVMFAILFCKVDKVELMEDILEFKLYNESDI
jgi:hypothetical protein